MLISVNREGGKGVNWKKVRNKIKSVLDHVMISSGVFFVCVQVMEGVKR